MIEKYSCFRGLLIVALQVLGQVQDENLTQEKITIRH
jgi:hypothetical protein